jgi:3-oxoacyl-[acyl-carrier protein] reductase
LKPTVFDVIINVNLLGDFHIIQRFFQHAINNLDGARIINIACDVGQIGNAGQTNYAASKGGVIGFTKSLAKKELAPNNSIKVNAMCPGCIEITMNVKLTKTQLEVSLAAIPLHQ